VSGLIAQYPLGGLTWHYLQYLLGLRDLGHDVYYLEDSGAWPYDPETGGLGRDCSPNVAYLRQTLSRFGLGEKWMYRFAWRDQWFGLADRERREVLGSADLLLNVSGTLERPADHRARTTLVYIDTDPVFTQLRLARKEAEWLERVGAHDVHFTFGERVPETMPPTGFHWRSTRQPIALAEWRPAAPHGGAFTTVMNWTSYESVEYEGHTYGQKNVEFERFLDLPARVPEATLEIALAPGKNQQAPRERLVASGWRVVDPARVCADLDAYRRYLESSRAEWSVAKNAYVQGQSGWFSERSACFLAAGRPVVVQDTGFSATLPVGEGLLAFRDVEGAAAAIREVQADPVRHRRAARAIAEEYFDSRRVLSRLIDEAAAVRPSRRSP